MKALAATQEQQRLQAEIFSSDKYYQTLSDGFYDISSISGTAATVCLLSPCAEFSFGAAPIALGAVSLISGALGRLIDPTPSSIETFYFMKDAAISVVAPIAITRIPGITTNFAVDMQKSIELHNELFDRATSP